MDYTITLATTLKEVELIRPIWETLQWHPNADIDLYQDIIKTRESIVRPHVMLLTRKESPKVLVVGRVEDTRLISKLGYARLWTPRMRALSVIYGGIMGTLSEELSNAIVDEVLRTLNDTDIDVVFFNGLRTDSYLYRILREKPTVLLRDHTEDSKPHWVMTLSSSIDHFYSSLASHHRHELRRYPRALEKAFSGKIEYRKLESTDEVSRICEDAEKISRKTYHRGIGVGFQDSLESRTLLHRYARMGMLVSYFVYIHGNPRAFWMGINYNGTVYLTFTGYDSDYAKYQLGTILFIKMIEDLHTLKVQRVDFGFGDAFYKRRYCAENWPESAVYVFAPRIKCVLVNMTRWGNYAASNLLSKALQDVQCLEKVKRLWRKYSIGR